MYRRGDVQLLRNAALVPVEFCANAFLGFLPCNNGRLPDCAARLKSVSSLPSSQTTTPSRFNRSTFSSCNTMPPPVTMIACVTFARLRSALVSTSRNLSSPYLAKISGIDIPMLEAMISSVSCKANFVRRARQSPTEDLPAPIMPMRTIDRPTSFTLQHLINSWLQPHSVAVMLSEAKHLWMRSFGGQEKPEIPRLRLE